MKLIKKYIIEFNKLDTIEDWSSRGSFLIFFIKTMKSV